MTPTVLIAEHQPRVRVHVTHALADDGCAVETVDSGEEALARIAKATPHIVLLDAELPDIDGIEILLGAKSDERTKKASFVMITDNGRDNKVVAALELGATDFIPKPFSEAVIRARVRNVIRVRSVQERMRRAEELAVAFFARLRLDRGTLLETVGCEDERRHTYPRGPAHH